MSASTPRILQSADEAPCGSLCQSSRTAANGRLVMHLWNGEGWNISTKARPALGTADGFKRGWDWTIARSSCCIDFPARLIAEGLTEAECRHLSGLSAADAIVWCETRQATSHVAETCKGNVESLADAKPRPQPGDVVTGASALEAGCLYSKTWGGCPFVVVTQAGASAVTGPADNDIYRNLAGGGLCEPAWGEESEDLTLVARDLGSDPEAWRRAMREWTANGNKPAAPVTPLAAAVADIDATAEVSESAAWAKIKAALRVAEDERNTALEMADHRLNELRKAETALSAADRAKRAADRERDEARAGWAEQSADAARLRLALEKAQQQIVQAHEDIDALIAKQTATDRELLKTQAAMLTMAAQQMSALSYAAEAQHRGRIVGRLLDEMSRGYFVDRFLDPNLYADAMKAAGREVKS